MGIDAQRVVVAGLVAGLVVNVPDGLVSGLLVADEWAGILARQNLAPTPLMIPFYIGCNFVAGLVMVWTYAAMRPRFGPGPRTALLSGALFTFVTHLYGFGHVIVGQETLHVYLMMAMGLVTGHLLGALAGAAMYREAWPC